MEQKVHECKQWFKLNSSIRRNINTNISYSLECNVLKYFAIHRWKPYGI